MINGDILRDAMLSATNNLTNYVNAMEGMNFSAWLNSLRVEEAQKLMKSHPELSIFDIGYKVGHPHPNTFKKAFITITGQTPDEWRKENIETEKDND